ncbi:uncharacterized protein LOC125040958 [Penaeus chinensis]|uniref:uncharacterized protein LOC125040958 n=1 Tax=Penaeus chinensis TaxID=139456 RepID=UPI001FB73FE7|nr:uncharacterized protein LOC125040958 [Penaeus chinensis]
MSAYLIAPVVYQLQESLRHVDFRSLVNSFDVRSWIGQLEYEKVGLFALVAVAAVLLFDWFNKNYTPNGPNFLVSSPPVWDVADHGGFKHTDTHDSLSLNNRSLETVTKVFRALTEAVEKWEDPQDFSTRHRAT